MLNVLDFISDVRESKIPLILSLFQRKNVLPDLRSQQFDERVCQRIVYSGRAMFTSLKVATRGCE